MLFIGLIATLALSSPVLGRAFLLVAKKMKRSFNIFWLDLGYFTNMGNCSVPEGRREEYRYEF